MITEQKDDTQSEMQCRYCLESGNKKNLLSLCACRGSVRYVHGKCLFRWISHKRKNHRMLGSQMVNCEICKYPIRLCIMAPAWFPFVLSKGVFWKSLLDVTLTVLGILCYLKGLTQSKKSRKRRCILFNILARGLCMNISCGFLDYLTLDDILRMPCHLRPSSFFRKIFVVVRTLASFAVSFSWFKYLVTLIQRSIYEINAERLKFATWSFKATRSDLRELCVPSDKHYWWTIIKFDKGIKF